VLSIPGTGLVGGVVYLDVDGNRQAGGPDNGLQNVRVRLVVAGTGDTVARATSDANGTFVLGSVPVGRYTVVLPGEAVFGDTIAIVRIDTADVSLNPDDTVQVQVAVSYPKVTIAEARQLPLGTKVFIEGVALNSLPTFGDTTVSIEDTTGALRITGVRGPLVALGDSVRFLGKLARETGRNGGHGRRRRRGWWPVGRGVGAGRGRDDQRHSDRDRAGGLELRGNGGRRIGAAPGGVRPRRVRPVSPHDLCPGSRNERHGHPGPGRVRCLATQAAWRLGRADRAVR
jgi:hypothetical protein